MICGAVSGIGFKLQGCTLNYEGFFSFSIYLMFVYFEYGKFLLGSLILRPFISILSKAYFTLVPTFFTSNLRFEQIFKKIIII